VNLVHFFFSICEGFFRWLLTVSSRGFLLVVCACLWLVAYEFVQSVDSLFALSAHFWLLSALMCSSVCWIYSVV
jgi:hypothetical protein